MAWVGISCLLLFGLELTKVSGYTTPDRVYPTSTELPLSQYIYCGTYNENRGLITSWNYPYSYSYDERCRRIVNTDQPVYFKVLDADLDPCCDHLRIFDQDGSEWNWNVTGNLYSSNITVLYHTDGSGTRRGFKLEWDPHNEPTGTLHSLDNTTDCGTFNGHYGRLSSPNYPRSYPNHLNCRYTIIPGQKVYLRTVDFHLETCCDHLKIFDKYGFETTGSSNSSVYSDNFTVTFTSDGNVTNRGFEIVWNTYEPTLSPDRFRQFTDFYSQNPSTSPRPAYSTSNYDLKDCGTYTSDTGSITSPNYPYSYPNNVRCRYTVIPGHYVYLRLVDYHLESCCDHLKLVYGDGSEKNGSAIDISFLSNFTVEFTSDGSVTNRGFRIDWNTYTPSLSPDRFSHFSNVQSTARQGYETTSANWGWQTTGWGWGTTIPYWWRYTTESRDKISVNCNSHDFTVSVPRDVIKQVFPGVSEYNLALINSNCRGQVYYDVVMFRSNILGCGMTREETRYDIVYQNRISPLSSGGYTTDSYRYYTTEAPIARFDSRSIKVECHLDNYATAIGHFNPTNNHELVARGRGNVSVYMDFYRDYNYNYKITSYPIRLGLNEDVYVDLRLDSGDPGLNMAVQRCIATPTYSRYSSEYHTLIRSGCPEDQTVAFEHTSGDHVHFRFRGFEFLREKSDVFIFCDVNICNSTDYSSRCHRNCNRRRRDVENEPEAESDLNLFQGPLKFRDERSADQHSDNAIDEKTTQSMSISASVIAISAVAMVIAAVVLVTKRRKRYELVQA